MTLDEYKQKLKISRALPESRYWVGLKGILRRDFPTPKGKRYCVMCCRDVSYLMKGLLAVCAQHDGYVAIKSERSKFELELRRVQCELRNKARRDRARRDGPLRGGWYVAPCVKKEKTSDAEVAKRLSALEARCDSIESFLRRTTRRF